MTDPDAQTPPPPHQHTRRRLLAGGAAGVGAGFLSAASTASGAPPVPNLQRDRMPLDVRDFGALGDGSLSDNAAIQSALDAGAGGAVFLPPGRYPIEGLAIPSHTELFGSGWNSQLVVQPGAGLYPLLVRAGTHDVRLRDFAIDGNKARVRGDSLVHASPAVALIAQGTRAAPCERIYVDRLRVFDHKRLGIVLQSVRGGGVRDCAVEDNERDGITVYFDSKNITIRGNTVARCGDDYIAVNSEDRPSPEAHLCESIVVAENTLTGPGPGGRGRGMTIRGGKDIVVAANAIRDVSQSGVVIESIARTSATDIVVSGNTIFGSGAGGAADKWGVWLRAAGDASVRRVTITGNNIRATEFAAIGLRDDKVVKADDDVADVVIADNSVENARAEGIVLGSRGISDVSIQGNRVKGSARTGIDCIAGAKRVHVRDNVVYRGAAHGIRLSIADSGSCEGNQVYDDRTGAAATQTHGIYMHALSGTWAFRDNTVWGNREADYDLHAGSHRATFDGPYRTLSGTGGWNPTSLANGAGATTIVRVAGARAGDPCTVGIGVPLPGGATLSAAVTERDTVTVTLFNNSGRPLDLPGGTLWVHVQKPPPL